jgi:hypothetical protein
MYKPAYLRKQMQQEQFKSRDWKDYPTNDDFQKDWKHHSDLKNKALKRKDYLKATYHDQCMYAITSERKKPSSVFKKLAFTYAELKYPKKGR